MVHRQKLETLRKRHRALSFWLERQNLENELLEVQGLRDAINGGEGGGAG